MAFTEAQKVDIRFFLGYPNILIYKNPRLEGAIEVVGANPDAQLKVEVLLAKLNTVFGVNPGDPSQIDQVLQQLGLVEVESADDKVKFGDAGKQGSYSSSIQNSLVGYAKMLSAALSSFMGVPIASDIFGTFGYIGDRWQATSGMSMGPGNFALGSF